MRTELDALRAACSSGLGFQDAAETERVSRWALAEIERLRELIRTAPHAVHCEAGASLFPGPCNCWKKTRSAIKGSHERQHDHV